METTSHEKFVRSIRAGSLVRHFKSINVYEKERHT